MTRQKILLYGQKIIGKGRSKKMARVYHKCYFCGGQVSEKKVTVDYRWGEDLIAVFRNVPAGVCQVCGEQYYKADIVKEMEKLVTSKEKAKEFIHVPVRELQVV
jgi:YgiT-type zinc finger domain-containing protein